jgi:hypothetical protein
MKGLEIWVEKKELGFIILKILVIVWAVWKMMYCMVMVKFKLIKIGYLYYF